MVDASMVVQLICLDIVTGEAIKFLDYTPAENAIYVGLEPVLILNRLSSEDSGAIWYIVSLLFRHRIQKNIDWLRRRRHCPKKLKSKDKFYLDDFV